MRREAGDRLRFYCSRRRENAWVVFANDQRILYILHVDIAEDEVAHVVAAIAIRLDANTVVGAFKMNALGENVARAAGDLAADGEAVAVHEGAIGDGDVAAWVV